MFRHALPSLAAHPPASWPRLLQVRILQLLASIPSRQERADLLPDAFTPLEDGGPAQADGEGSEGEEELLSTTPLALLQVGWSV